MSTTEPLLPCPFCGDEGEITPHVHALALKAVVCDQCSSSSGWYLHEEEAIAAWNRRTPPAVPDVSKTVKQRAWEIADQLWLDTNEKSKLARLICDAFSAAPTPPVDDGWRPIATAPKDGTDVLLYGLCKPFVESDEFVGFYIAGFHDGEWISLHYDDQGQNMWMKPTHWRPLPPQPREGE